MFSHLRELGINALVLSRTGLLAVWVAETWNKLFQRQEFWCREAAQSALRQWWACPGRIIHSSTKKLPPPRNMLSSDVSLPSPSLPSYLDFFLACMYPCENPSLSSLSCGLTPSGSLQPCCSLSKMTPYTLVDCFGWGWEAVGGATTPAAGSVSCHFIALTL